MAAELEKYLEELVANAGDDHLDTTWLRAQLALVQDKVQHNILDRRIREIDIRNYFAQVNAQPEDNTPYNITHQWKIIWNIWTSYSVDTEFEMPECDRSKEEIDQLQREGRMLVYIPDQLADEDGLTALTGIFPELRSPLEKDNHLHQIKNSHAQSGWIDIDAMDEPPHLGLSTLETNNLRSDHRQGMTLNTYIVGAMANRIFNGHFFDSVDAYTRIMDSTINELPLIARLDDRDGLHMIPANEPIHIAHSGIRTVSSPRVA